MILSTIGEPASTPIHQDKENKKHRLLGSIMLLLFFTLTVTVHANNSEDSDIGTTLLHHISDKHSWQPIPFLPSIPLNDFTIGPVTIHITQFVFMLLINAVLLIVVFTGAFRKVRVVPSKSASLLEPVIFFVRDSIVYPSMGKEMGSRWLPFFLTLFFFILSNNLLGLIPLFGTATGNLSVTIALAIMIFLLIIGTGIRKNGVIGFFRNMMPQGLPLPIQLLLLAIEIPGLIIRSGVLAIRLFANMIAGHFVIYSLLLLIFIIHPLAGTVSVPMAVFIDLLEVLVAVIQAIVFTMLSAIFIQMAVAHH